MREAGALRFVLSGMLREDISLYMFQPDLYHDYSWNTQQDYGQLLGNLWKKDDLVKVYRSSNLDLLD
jgi:hypothetical protein